MRHVIVLEYFGNMADSIIDIVKQYSEIFVLKSIKPCLFYSVTDISKFIPHPTAKWKSWLWSRRRWPDSGGFVAASSTSLRIFPALPWVNWFSAHYWQEGHWPEICTAGKYIFIIVIYITSIRIDVCMLDSWFQSRTLPFFCTFSFLFSSFELT